MNTMMPNPWFTATSRAFPVEMLMFRSSRSLSRTAALGLGERQLSWLVLPDFQRPPVWSQAQQVRFIESIWGGLPIGAYVYNRAQDGDGPTDNWLLDGQQRITALMAYVDDAFPVLGHLYSEITEIDRRRFGMREFPALETRIDDVDQLREVYDRLAYGGTPHEPKGEKKTSADSAGKVLTPETGPELPKGQGS